MGRVAARRTFRHKTFLPKHMMRCDDESLLDRSRSELSTTASGVARQGTCGNYATDELSENKTRKRGGRRMKRQWEMWKGRRTFIRVGTLNDGTMIGRGENWQT